MRALWGKRDPATALTSDRLLAAVDGERATATLHFSAHAHPTPSTSSRTEHGMRVVAGLFEPLFAVERVRAGARPLVPVRNGIAVGRSYAGAALRGLWRKLAGRPTALEGLGELVRRTYAAIAAGTAPPLSIEHILAVHRLEEELLSLEGAP